VEDSKHVVGWPAFSAYKVSTSKTPKLRNVAAPLLVPLPWERPHRLSFFLSWVGNTQLNH